MAKGLLFGGQKNGGYCNIHKGINFNNSAQRCSCLFLFTRTGHVQSRGQRDPQRAGCAERRPLPARAAPRTARKGRRERGSAYSPALGSGGCAGPGAARGGAARAPAAAPRPLRAAPPRARPDSPDRGERGSARRQEGNGAGGPPGAERTQRHTKEPPGGRYQLPRRSGGCGRPSAET